MRAYGSPGCAALGAGPPGSTQDGAGQNRPVWLAFVSQQPLPVGPRAGTGRSPVQACVAAGRRQQRNSPCDMAAEVVMLPYEHNVRRLQL